MLSPRAALALFILVVAMTIAGGVFFGGGLAGIALVEAVCIAVPAVAAVRAAGGRLPLAWPRPRMLAGSVLCGASAWWVLVALVMPLQERIAPMPPELLRALEGAVAPDAPLVAVWLALALTPAICEELLCRGVLLFSFRARLGPVWAVVASAALFAALHLSPYRLLPTFALGLLFGALALRARTIVPSMIAHALNNLAVVLVGHPAGASIRSALDAHPAGATVGAVAVLTIGLTLAMRKE